MTALDWWIWTETKKG